MDFPVDTNINNYIQFYAVDYPSQESTLFFDEKLMNREDDFIKNYCKGNPFDDYSFSNKYKDEAMHYVQNLFIFALVEQQQEFKNIIQNLQDEIKDLKESISKNE
jgi:hypothetical protein